jgi:cyclopropane fatty-acyl-phospholipid synthase-like methyltransferase
MEYPDFVSRFYDVIYRHIRTAVDHDYYLEKMRSARGAVLEVGVGTGRLFLDALRSDVDIYGVDLSRTMIRQLKKKLDPSEARRVTVQDVRKLSLRKKFKLIVAPFRVFGHVVTTQDQITALEKVRGHLDRHGMLIFDLFVPDLAIAEHGLPPTVDFEGEWQPGKKLKRITSVKPDLIRQVNHVTMRYIWEEDGQTMDKTWSFPMRYYFRYELEHLVKRAGFKTVRIFGDFRENPLDRDSKEFVVVCSKP